MKLALILALFASQHFVHLTWNKPSPARAVTVVYGTIHGGPYPIAGCTAKPKATACNVRKLTTGTYYFVAYFTNGNGSYSNEVKALVP
jgi:hypothetical protein